MVKTLSDAVAIVEFLVSHQGKSIDEAISEAEIPQYLKEQVTKYFAPPLEITYPELIIGGQEMIPRCDPRLDSIQQCYGAFRRFLIEERGWAKSTVDTLAETSLNLVTRLPKPDSVDKFQERGLVIGHIQSGKTVTMSALIARCADEGYKLFIVLGGLWKDLRSQTQRRLDQEITGNSDNFDDSPFVKYDTGVPKWVRLTQSGPEGDFRQGTVSDYNPETLKLAVILKNNRIRKLMRWLEKTEAYKLPAVILDDEADHASIDTNYGRVGDDGEQLSPSQTNNLIRNLLGNFSKCVYIGFTATPFANVLIDSETEDDLYPKDFIASLPEPPGYFGPRKLFGLGMTSSDLSPNEAEKPALDVIREVSGEDLDQIDNALKRGGEAPTVLSDTVLAFILSSCGRLARGHNKEHFSMLVHPSQQTIPQRIFAKAIQDELRFLINAAQKPTLFPVIINRARKMWNEDFLRVTKEINDSELEVNDFETIWKFAKQITESIEIKTLNYKSSDKLDYRDDPKRYIVIGGNKLSRGMTLEGLSISLFTRSSNQYDTLLQMGRWFGYRPQYYDLTRIYVDKQTEEKFAELARVEDELRADIRKYSQEPNPPTPLQLKPIIRAHPTMVVTSKLKMGAARNLSISFQNTVQQTVSFPVNDKNILANNIKAANSFILRLSGNNSVTPEEKMYIWKDIPAKMVINFLETYAFSSEARDVNGPNLTSYIKRQNYHEELILWDIVLPEGSKKEITHSWTKNIFTHKVFRSPLTSKSIRVLSDPSEQDKWLELTGRDKKDPTRGCLMLYLIDKKSGLENKIKFFNKSTDAEDILGLVFIFPESKSNETIEYISQ